MEVFQPNPTDGFATADRLERVCESEEESVREREWKSASERVALRLSSEV